MCALKNATTPYTVQRSMASAKNRPLRSWGWASTVAQRRCGCVANEDRCARGVREGHGPLGGRGGGQRGGGGENDDERGAATGSAPSRGRMGAPEASVRVTAPGVRGDCGVGAESGGEPDDGCTGATTIGAPEASVRVIHTAASNAPVGRGGRPAMPGERRACRSPLLPGSQHDTQHDTHSADSVGTVSPMPTKAAPASTRRPRRRAAAAPRS